jgi:hypothetical protein
VKFSIEKSFDRDVDRIKDRKVLRKLRRFISMIENADTIREIPHMRRLKATNHIIG